MEKIILRLVLSFALPKEYKMVDLKSINSFYYIGIRKKQNNHYNNDYSLFPRDYITIKEKLSSILSSNTIILIDFENKLLRLENIF